MEREIYRHEEFRHLREVVVRMNERINLTRIVGDEDFRIKNIEDSLEPLFLSRAFAVDGFPDGGKMIDVGTGGGFPLLPLAMYNRLVFPSRGFSYCGLDSVGKKMRALAEIAGEMRIENIHFISGRAEVYGRDMQFRERFDLATCRAVAELPVVLEYCSPFVKVGGVVAVYKAKSAAEEMEKSGNAACRLGLQLIETCAYALSQQQGERVLFLFRKGRPISADYPRKDGVPKKAPLS